MSVHAITSRQHPFVQRCRRLASGRGEAGDVLLDGPHLLEDAVAAGVPIDAVLVDDRHPSLAANLRARGVTVHDASRAVIEAASPVRSPSGVVAIARWAPQPASALMALPRPLLIGLVGVQDPGNVGTIIRTADALGSTGVLVLDDTAAPSGWKALRAAMGSTFRLPIGVGTTADALPAVRRLGIRIVASVAAGGVLPDADVVTTPALVLIGSEGAGLPADVVSEADLQVTLPMRARVNSLNAATTAALLIWDMTRARRRAGDAP